MEQTKAPTRDYPSYSDTPWTLWDTLYARRSHRKYMPGSIDPDLMGRLEDVRRLAVTARGAGEGSLVLVTDAQRVQGIKRRAHKGMQGKINLWLDRAPLAGFLALALPREDVRSGRPRRLPPAAAAAEDLVLWLTEAGLGTCWLGGLNQGEVKEVLGLGRDTFVSALICFGRPKPQAKARDVDYLMYRRISRKRKLLSDIAYLENMDNPYRLPRLEIGPFSASTVQDVAGLLRQLQERRESDRRAPLALALEACCEAARIAPSAGNTQAWRFVAVTGEDALRELAGACGAGGKWRLAVAGLGSPDQGFLYERMEKPFWMIDLPIAFSQMSLLAASMDLAVDLRLAGFDEEAVNAAVGARPPLRTVGVMGIR